MHGHVYLPLEITALASNNSKPSSFAAAWNRRDFLVTLAAAGAACGTADDGWVELFDGKTLDGWQPNENPDTWKVVDGYLADDGPRSHLVYVGPVQNADFRNFELEVEAMTEPNCNSGIHFHTAAQDTGWLRQGFESQINNTAGGARGYLERKKTGSLYAVRNVYKQLANDNEWFTTNITVRGKNIQTRINGMLVVDYTEPATPLLHEGSDMRPVLGHGTFAIQGHDPGSHVKVRRIRVRPLADDVAQPDTPAAADDAIAQDIINLGASNIPLVDYHVHLREGLSLEQALTKSHYDGLFYGIAAACGEGFPIANDESALEFLASLKGQPVFAGFQAQGRDWTQRFSSGVVSQFDYTFTDAISWKDDEGKLIRMWVAEEIGPVPDRDVFMDQLVDRMVGMIENEPIDIFSNAGYLPAILAPDAEALWTEERMTRVIQAAIVNDVAIEINEHHKVPSLAFLRLAKAAGCKFAFGSDNNRSDDLGRCEYSIAMTKELGLVWQDFFVPGAWLPKAVTRKPEAFGV